MRPTKNQLDLKAKKLALTVLAVFIGAVMLVGACSSTENESNSQSGNIVSKLDISRLPDDGQAHVLYTDSYGVTIKGKVINVDGSYKTHLVWVENKGGSIYESSISTH